MAHACGIEGLGLAAGDRPALQAAVGLSSACRITSCLPVSQCCVRAGCISICLHVCVFALLYVCVSEWRTCARV